MKNLDIVVSRAKEAAATLTSNKRRKREGHVDQAIGPVKSSVGRARHAVTSSAKNGK